MLRFLALALLTVPLFAQVVGTMNTFAGNGSATFFGDTGQAKFASLNVPVDVSADRAGNIYIADQFNNRIRKVARDGTITTFAGTGVAGFAGDGGPAVSAQINTPTGVFADYSGNVFIAEPGNQRIRKVDSAGNITTFAGNGTKGFSGDGGPAASASLNNASRMAVDPNGNLFVADQSNHRIRKITPGGIISTIAGNGSGSSAPGAFSGDGGPAVSASLNNPTALTIDASGIIYFSDQLNHRIRKITTDGAINTIAGNGTAGFSGDAGPAISATLNYPGGIIVDSTGNLFFNDDLNYRTRKISSAGNISTIAGNGVPSFAGDGGPATFSSMNGNFGATVDVSGNLYIADSTNNRIRQVSAVANPGATPVIKTSGIVPIYSSATTIQPGSWISIFGNNLADAPTLWNNDFPTTLDRVTVTINSKLAYLWYVSPTQINLQAPDDVTTGTVNVVITTGGGTVTSSINLGPISPSLSVLDGRHVAGIILRSDGSGTYGGGTYDIIGPNGTSLGYKTVAARPGDSVAIYGVGFGPTNPSVQAGKLYSGAAPTTNAVQLNVNNTNVLPTFAGITSAGLYQINFTLPAGLGMGDYPLYATVGGIRTPLITISIQ